MTLKPLGDRLLLKMEPTVLSKLLHIPENSKPLSTIGVVVEKGTKEQPDIKIGDRLSVSEYGGYRFEANGCEYKLVSAEDVIAIWT